MLRDGFGAGARATSGRLSTPGWVTWSLISFGITAVSVPTLAVLYDVFVPIAFVLGILQGGSVLLAALRPWWGLRRSSRPSWASWPRRMPPAGRGRCRCSA
ncbi:hypothetical protein GCM10025869_36450 [Homoserinibacter gongjuensis]|uniref:Uncharacterized protein n=2 Tax=Homoserinibacter gongjuensis TaxID=1162968 RepID=A0ABQ6JXR6_9MICO|nr:hypothetical protein GCM10025869_36450 [Homoserinibacter gongjuensis]